MFVGLPVIPRKNIRLVHNYINKVLALFSVFSPSARLRPNNRNTTVVICLQDRHIFSMVHWDIGNLL